MADELTKLSNDEIKLAIEAIKKTPIETVEEDLVGFVKGIFNKVAEDNAFQLALENEIMGRLSSMTEAQLIALATNQKVNSNDLTSKILAPLTQLLTSKQQAEMAKTNAAAAIVQAGTGNGAMKEMNLQASSQVLNGLKAFGDLMGALSAAGKDITLGAKIQSTEGASEVP